AGTDIITGGIPGLALHHEMEMLVESGLTPMQALRAATSWSAEILEGKNKARGPAKIGSIRAGNFADLVVVGGDPLSDISNTKKIERVMKDGRWVEFGYHPEYFTFTQRPRSLAAATFAPTISAIEPSKVTEGSRGAGRQRLHDDVTSARKRRFGEDQVSRSAAAGVRDAGERDRACRTEPLFRARTHAEHGADRRPRSLRACVQS